MTELMLPIHILVSFMFFGGLLPVQILGPRAIGAQDPATRLALLGAIRSLNLALLMPGSLLAGITGFALAGMRHIPMTTPWLLASIVLYLVSFVLSVAVIGPWSQRLVVAAREARSLSGEDRFQAIAREPLPGIARIVTGVSGFTIVLLMLFHGRVT